MLYSVPLTVTLVVGTTLMVKLVLETSIFLHIIMILYPTWKQLQMVTIEIDSHGSFVSTVNPLVILLDSFNVIFLKLVGHLMLTYT